MTTGAMASLDDDDVGIRVLDQAVDERHAHRSGTDDEIVGLELTLLVHIATLTRNAGSVTVGNRAQSASVR